MSSLRFIGQLTCGATLGMLVACAADDKRPVGANCDSDAQCEQGLCGGGVCLDPNGDEDGDGLINRLEAGLGTDPLAADSDGDERDDALEVGAPGAPSDGDGDGKIDALESSTADVDADCIPDQQDADDGRSDPASPAHPDACGDGRVVGDPDDGGGSGDGELTPLCGADDELQGTCAASVGAMFYDCFAAAGTCVAFDNEAGTLMVQYANGSHLELVTDPAGTETITVFGPTGERCGIETMTVEQQASDERTITPVGGVDFRLWNEGTALFIECPDKTVIQPERGYDFARCAGLTFGCQVLTGSSCTADSDCAGGQVCCRFGTEQAFTDVCSPADKCDE